MSLFQMLADGLPALAARPWLFGLAKGAVPLAAAAGLHALLARAPVSATLRHAVLLGGVCAALAVSVAGTLPGTDVLRWHVAQPAALQPMADPGVLPAAATALSPAFPRLSLGVLWCLGAAAVLLPLAVAYGRLALLACRLRPVDDARMTALFAEACRQAGTGARLRQAPRAGQAPATFGFGRFARVVVPSDAAAWSDAECRMVFAHELAHVARGDWAGQVLSHALLAAQWFNPAAWWVCARLAREAEHACDDRVLAGGVRPHAYADGLLALAQRHAFAGAPAWARSSMPFTSFFTRRLTVLLDPSCNRRVPGARARVLLAACPLLVAAVLGVIGLAQAEAPDGGAAPVLALESPAEPWQTEGVATPVPVAPWRPEGIATPVPAEPWHPEGVATPVSRKESSTPTPALVPEAE